MQRDSLRFQAIRKTVLGGVYMVAIGALVVGLMLSALGMMRK